MRDANQRYLNDVEDRMDSCHDPVKILMGGPSEGRKKYAMGGAVDGLLGRPGHVRKAIPVDTNPDEIKVAMMSTSPNSKMSRQAQMRGDMRTGPAYRKGGHVDKGGFTIKNQESASNAEKGMPVKMGLHMKDGGRTKRAMGGVGKIRHEQYE